MNPLARILTDAAARHGERIAFVDRSGAERREATYADVLAAARRGAGALRDAGIGPGDRVLLCAANSLEFPSAFFAALMAGATLVPAPILSSQRELAFRIRHAGCRLALCDAERAAAVRSAAASIPRELTLLEIGGLATARNEPLRDAVDVGENAPGLILYTSGTTGTPRGTVIAQETLVGHTRVIGIDALGLGPDDRILGVLPFTHSYGCRTAMLTTFLAGACCILTGRFDAEASLRIACEEDVSFIPAVPTMFARWGVLPAGPRPPRLHTSLAAGAPLADEIVSRAEARLGGEIRQAYGMTEATLATIDAPPAARKLGSVGRAAPDSEVRIVASDGTECAAGKRGEIRIRGGGVMLRYLDDDAATARALVQGWMRTGDIGWLDDDGYLHVVGRIKDMIIRGGNNIYPAELEAVLMELPEVAAAAVIGRPHETHGEDVVAVLELTPGARIERATLDRFAEDAFARNKRPRDWAVVDAMPLGPSNKILKRVLRSRLERGELDLLT